MRCEEVDQINLSQDKDERSAVVTTVMNVFVT